MLYYCQISVLNQVIMQNKRKTNYKKSIGKIKKVKKNPNKKWIYAWQKDLRKLKSEKSKSYNPLLNLRAVLLIVFQNSKNSVAHFSCNSSDGGEMMFSFSAFLLIKCREKKFRNPSNSEVISCWPERQIISFPGEASCLKYRSISIKK